APMASARSRGFLPASFASTMAALVAMSPCAASRGGSTTMRDWSIPAGSMPSAISARLAARTWSSTAAKMFWSLMVNRTFGSGRLTYFPRQVKAKARYLQPSGKPATLARVSVPPGRGYGIASTQLRRRLKQSRVLDERIAVGHPGNEIGDAAQPRGLVAGLRALDPIGRNGRRRSGVPVEELADDALGIAHDAHDAGMPVHARVEEILDSPVGLRHR